MGGNALGSKIDRMNPEEYQEVVSHVLSALSKTFEFGPGGGLNDAIISYADKPSHGDVDIMLEQEFIPLLMVDDIPNQYEWLKKLATDNFGAQRFSANNSVLSFDYNLIEGKSFQVDFMITPSEVYKTQFNYYAYNDLGNLIGRIANKMNVTFGHEGLQYQVRTKSNLLGKVLLSKDLDVSLEFLGFSSKRYREGFKTMNEMFDFIKSGKFFATSLFALENLNHANRTRNRKRKTFMLFVEDLEKNPQPKEKDFVFPDDKNEWIPYIEKTFPNLKSMVQKVVEEHAVEMESKNLLSGKRVMEWTGFKGIRLGALIEIVNQKVLNDGSSIEKIHQDMGEEGLVNLVVSCIHEVPSEEFLLEKSKREKKIAILNGQKKKL